MYEFKCKISRIEFQKTNVLPISNIHLVKLIFLQVTFILEIQLIVDLVKFEFSKDYGNLGQNVFEICCDIFKMQTTDM